jgi:glycosyltransferase involved in cell wall biosynthesis
MKILHISFSSSGGAGYSVANLNRGLREFGIDSNVKYLIKGNLLRTGLGRPILMITSLIDFFVVKKRKSNGLFSMFRKSISSAVVDKNKYDIIHLHWVPGILGVDQILKLLQAGQKIVWTVHDSFPFSGGCHVQISCSNLDKSCIQCPQAREIFHHKVYFNKLKKRYILSHENIFLIAPSKWMKNEIERSGIANNKIQVIPNLVNTKVVGSNHSNGKSYIVESSIKNEFCVAIVTNTVYDKVKRVRLVNDLLEKIRALKKDKDKEIIFYIYGNGNIKIESSKVVKVNSKKMSLRDLYLRTDILMSLSEFESFGNSIIEANSYGKPALIYGEGGQKELIIEGQNGFCFENLNLLATKIVELSRDTELMNQMSKNSLNVYKENFTQDLILKRHLETYKIIMNNSRD